MTLLFATLMILLAAGMFSLHFLARLRRMKAAGPGVDPGASMVADRYRPMLRLLSADDAALVSSNKALARKLRRQRVEMFRSYLACLSMDYGRLLAGIRFAMVQSNVDRPDLAAALARNQMIFTLAVCRIEYRLFLHNLGLGSVDVSGLVDAFNSLRSQSAAFNPMPIGAS